MSRVPFSAACIVLVTLTLLGVATASAASASKNVGSVNFSLGGRRFGAEWNTSAPSTGVTGDTLATRRSQPALGIEVSWGHSGWPAMIALDVLHSYDDGIQQYPANPLIGLPAATVRRRFSTLEIGLGVRRAWHVKGLSPYIGGGASMVRAAFSAEMDTSNAGAHGSPGPSIGHSHHGVGFWVGGGLYRRLGPRFQLGLTGRYAKAKLAFPERGQVRGEVGGYGFVNDPSSSKIEAGGRHIGLIVGWSFPSRP